MPKKKKERNHSPSYYIRKRLSKNIPALFGLCIIILAHVIAILGYLIMPDDSPMVSTQYHDPGRPKQPGWECIYIKKTLVKEYKKVGWFQKMLFGQESNYSLTAIHDYTLDENTLDLTYTKYYDSTRIRSKKRIKVITEPLIKTMRRVYVGYSDKLGKSALEQYVVTDNTIKYLDENEKLVEEKKSDLVAEFKRDWVVTKRFYLGTDKHGRDLYSRLIFGTRISLSVGGIAVLISLVLGVFLGALAGFFGGWVDSLVMWLMTVIWSIPTIILVIAIALALGDKGVWAAFVAVGLTMWVEVARVVRGQIFAVREKLFVEAARALGINNIRIIFRHILPNIMGPLIVIAASNFATAILIEAGLSFLDLGVERPKPSWGRMVLDANELIGGPQALEQWHLLVYPGICISLLVLAFNLLGNGLRDAYDPKSMLK